MFRSWGRVRGDESCLDPGPRSSNILASTPGTPYIAQRLVAAARWCLREAGSRPHPCSTRLPSWSVFLCAGCHSNSRVHSSSLTHFEQVEQVVCRTVPSVIFLTPPYEPSPSQLPCSECLCCAPGAVPRVRGQLPRSNCRVCKCRSANPLGHPGRHPGQRGEATCCRSLGW